MDNHTGRVLYYPNHAGRIFLQSFEEIIGRNGINAVLNTVNLAELIENYPPNNPEKKVSFSVISRILVGVEGVYGPRAGRGLAMRAGTASFKYGLREFGSAMGVTDIEFRLLPLHTKMRVGLETLAKSYNRFSDQHVTLEESAEQFLWIVDSCALCWERRAAVPVCQWTTGMLQESLLWLSGGKYFNVEEIECIAMGAPRDVYKITKQPLD